MTDYPKVSRKEFQEAIEAGIKHFMFHPKEAEQLREVGRTATLTVIGAMVVNVDDEQICGCPLIQSGVVTEDEPEYNTIGFWGTFDGKMRDALNKYLKTDELEKWGSPIVRITDD